MSTETTERVGNGHDAQTETGRAVRGVTTKDPELVAMVKISNVLNKLSATDRATVLRFLGEKYAEHFSE